MGLVTRAETVPGGARLAANIVTADATGVRHEQEAGDRRDATTRCARARSGNTVAARCDAEKRP